MAFNMDNLDTLQPMNPILLAQLARWVQCCNQPNASSALQALQGPYVPDPYVRFDAGSDTSVNVLTVNNSNQLLVMFGGSTSYAQIANLVLGIQAGPSAADSTVAVSTFYSAALTMYNFIRTGFGGWNNKRVYVAGHSFGGAVAQVFAALVQITQQAQSVKVWSFGAPRPGTSTFAHRMSFMNNYRIFTTPDVVPWLAPHGDEIPTMLVTSAITLWRNCNTLCQAPTGYSLDGFGRLTPSMGNPPNDWTVTLGITRYMASVMVGGAGPGHSMQGYINWLDQAVQNYPVAPPRPIQPEQAPLTLRPRERDALIAIGEAEIFADATSPSGITRNYLPPSVTDPAAPRYKAARDGLVWVVKLGEEIVAAATGKRHAKKLARNWNKSARMLLNV